MLYGNTTLKDLMVRYSTPGRLEWIGLRPAPRAPLEEIESVDLLTACGLAGDHCAARRGGKRQVTLIQAEHLPVIAALVGREQVMPQELRRNLVVSGINLLALIGKEFSVGGAVLKATGPCVPCSRMEENLGRGGYNAVRGHGGITAMVVEGATIRIGDSILPR